MPRSDVVRREDVEKRGSCAGGMIEKGLTIITIQFSFPGGHLEGKSVPCAFPILSCLNFFPKCDMANVTVDNFDVSDDPWCEGRACLCFRPCWSCIRMRFEDDQTSNLASRMYQDDERQSIVVEMLKGALHVSLKTYGWWRDSDGGDVTPRLPLNAAITIAHFTIRSNFTSYTRKIALLSRPLEYRPHCTLV